MCSPGYYCRYGVDRPEPIPYANTTNLSTCPLPLYFGDHTGAGGVCLPGEYCPRGSPEPLPCPAGTYTLRQGQSSCQTCPEGFFCPSNTSDFTQNSCPQGHYCLSGTQHSTQYPCPEGSFNNRSRQSNSTSCHLCTPGSFCQGVGQSTPSGLCSPGWYCPRGSTTSTPTNSSCPIGYYCPIGSPSPVHCDGGYFCNSTDLSTPSGLCQAGYFCSSASPSPTPFSPEGGVCPTGHFCPQGSARPHPCPPGTFLNSTGNTALSDCRSCTEGTFCHSHNHTLPAGYCSAGYYCPEGQNVSSPSEFPCPSGHFCPTGSRKPLVCNSGTFQANTGRSYCDVCPAGYFCDNINGTNGIPTPTICPSGHYCPAGTSRSKEYPCNVGTFNNKTGASNISSCVPCSAGYACPQSGLSEPSELCSAGYFCRAGAMRTTPNQGSLAAICPAGFFCEEGSPSPQGCPKGTFSVVLGLRSANECQLCTPGSFCAQTGQTSVSGLCQEGSFCPLGSDSSTQVVCTAGHFCPTGSPSATPCRPGTFSPSTGLANQTQCRPCTPGSFCNQSGLTTPSGLCSPGFYCPGSVVYFQPSSFQCPVGMHCPEGSHIPLSCLPGFFTNTTQASSCQVCPAGFFCLPVNSFNASSAYRPCPAGFYCPLQTGANWQPCPAGSYSNRTGLRTASECLPCPAGSFCNGGATSPTGKCQPGFYCLTSNIQSDPPGQTLDDLLVAAELVNTSCPGVEVNTTIGGPCPKGHFCLEGTGLPVPCHAGSYNDKTAQHQCLPCPAGFFCPTRTVTFVGNVCPSGNFCPENTTSAESHPCAGGSFNNRTQSTSAASCLPCPAGQFCEGSGLSHPTGPCPPGWYCLRGASLRNPTNPLQGGLCSPGHFCPLASRNQTSCPAGRFCNSSGLSTPSGLCDAGFFCVEASETARPADNVTGNFCPHGNFCPQGSSSPVACPIGYFLNRTHGVSQSDCQACLQGWYCASEGLDVPTGLCQPGFFCPPGQHSARPFNYTCPKGHFCVRGSSEAQPCPPGQYQDLTMQSACTRCVEGHYCDGVNTSTVDYVDFVCPQGYYCPNGTSSAFSYPCPVGTFSNTSGLVSESQCSPCPGGLYCGTLAITAPSTLCAAGYFCRKGARTSTPRQSSDADICPVGHFCPSGTAEPEKCPRSTFNNVTGLQRTDQCRPCLPGRFCGRAGIDLPSGSCRGRYFCPEGSHRDDQVLCTAGYFCPQGSGSPTPCPAGFFSNSTGLESRSECTPCEEGSYCDTDGLTSPTGPCSPGYYCPTGQTSDTPANFTCPRGMHCPLRSATPRQCPPGELTQSPGQSTCQTCPAGYFCLPVMSANASLNLQPCPRGFFCPNGTGHNWRLCPAGSYSNHTGLGSVEECTPCSPGQFCLTAGLTSPTDYCQPGHFCTQGISVPNPANVTACTSLALPNSGGVCPPGTFCPRGSSTADLCAAGTYTIAPGQESCLPCPAGYFCQEGASSFADNVCPSGHYCPQATQEPYQYPCPMGTLNSENGSTNATACTLCPGGKYCATYGLSSPTGNCSEGWYCKSGAKNATDSVYGGLCPAGTFCPSGSSSPTNCPPGEYCHRSGLSAPTGPCSAGFWCRQRSVTARPSGTDSTGRICSLGHYCPQATTVERTCPQGTFANVTGLTSESECLSCTPGYFCDSPGLALPSGPCSAGYFCPPSQTTSTPSNFNCTLGHFCPQGSSQPSPCPSGTYQDAEQQSLCKTCPAGYFCGDNTSTVVIDFRLFVCPAGHYCLAGTRYAVQFPCPAGTATVRRGLRNESACDPCGGGLACTRPGLVVADAVCQAGYYCVKGARSTTPRQGPSEGDICPRGFYCPTGSSRPLSCDSGTFGAASGLENETDCTQCTAGMFCGERNLTNPSGSCAPGFYCPTGSSLSGQVVCPAGSFCPTGSFTPIPCPAGTYSNTTQLSSSVECVSCDAGFACNSTGLLKPSSLCFPGYYCPEGTNTSTPQLFVCPTALHCPEGSPAPQPCPSGSFTNNTGRASCLPCPPGFQCLPVTVNNASQNIIACPAGYFCPGRVGFHPTPCPAGSFSNVTGLGQLSDCQPCSPGWYCPTPALLQPFARCHAGHYCAQSNVIPNPTPANDTNLLSASEVSSEDENITTSCGPLARIGGVCPKGHFCPVGTGLPRPCLAGSYTNTSGQSVCLPCPAGFFCTSGTSDFVASPCPAGYFCLQGTPHASEYPCPSGTFSARTRIQRMADCASCPAGQFCRGVGLTAPTGNCTAGWHCREGAKTAIPAPENGRQCLVGEFCPSGTTAPINCTSGMYCDQPGLSQPAGSCDEGYFCPSGSSSRQQSPCPPGHFCPQESSRPTPCPQGTFLPVSLSSNESSCQPCQAGYACVRQGLAQPDANCSAGYFCISGSTSSTPAEGLCPQGHFCAQKSAQPKRCDSGTYQDRNGSSMCKTCPEGFFCDNRLSPVVLFGEDTICPAGYFCPNGTRHAVQHPCLPGTFSNNTGLRSASQCTPCQEGFYCDSPGLSSPAGECAAGFTCPAGSNRSAPAEHICPQGNFCPNGSILPQPCPRGTFADRLGTGGQRRMSAVRTGSLL